MMEELDFEGLPLPLPVAVPVRPVPPQGPGNGTPLSVIPAPSAEPGRAPRPSAASTGATVVSGTSAHELDASRALRTTVGRYCETAALAMRLADQMQRAHGEVLTAHRAIDAWLIERASTPLPKCGTRRSQGPGTPPSGPPAAAGAVVPPLTAAASPVLGPTEVDIPSAGSTQPTKETR